MKPGARGGYTSSSTPKTDPYQLTEQRMKEERERQQPKRFRFGSDPPLPDYATFTPEELAG